MIVEVPRVAPAELRADAPLGESSIIVRQRVIAARERQLQRAGVSNARLPPSELGRLAVLDIPARDLLERAMDRMQLSARAAQRILRVARTIADLAGSLGVERQHLAEAIGHRRGLVSK